MIPNLTLLLTQKTKNLLPLSSIKFKNNIISWVALENSKNRFSRKESYWTVQTSEVFQKKL